MSAPRPSTDQPVFELSGLTKNFSGTVAADRVTVTVPPGALTGLVGPNGAGKTTSLAMAVGLLRPDAGTAFVHGIDVWEEPTKAKELLGVLPDGLALPERLTGSELLTYWGLLRGMPLDEVRNRVTELLRILELAEADANGVLVSRSRRSIRCRRGCCGGFFGGS